jgi:hypothetical protein
LLLLDVFVIFSSGKASVEHGVDSSQQGGYLTMKIFERSVYTLTPPGAKLIAYGTYFQHLPPSPQNRMVNPQKVMFLN